MILNRASFNMPSNINVENFVKINNKYFKVVPSNYSSPDILYYSPNDLLDISNEEDYRYILNNFFEKFTITIPIGNYTISKLILSINEKFRDINLLIRNRINSDIKFLNSSHSFDLLLQCAKYKFNDIEWASFNMPSNINVENFENK